MSLCPGAMGLSFLSPITTWRMETPVSRGVPESVMATGILYSLRCSRSKETSVDRMLPVERNTVIISNGFKLGRFYSHTLCCLNWKTYPIGPVCQWIEMGNMRVWNKIIKIYKSVSLNPTRTTIIQLNYFLQN